MGINNQSNSPVNKTRRKLTIAGLTSPVVLGLSGRPVWASPTNCSFMKAVSGNLSVPGVGCNQTSASTVSPGWFKNHNDWSVAPVNAIYQSTEVFSTHFKSGPQVYIGGQTSYDSTLTFGQLFAAQSPPDVFQYISTATKPFDTKTSPKMTDYCFHYMAAFLMASSTGLVYPYTAQQIVADWGVWSLYSNIQAIENDLTVGGVMAAVPGIM